MLAEGAHADSPRTGARSMADVTYNTASFASLIRTLQTLVRHGARADENRPSPLIVLGYKERDAAERSLWELAADVGITFVRVGDRPGAGGNPVEVWLGRATGVSDGRVSHIVKAPSSC